MAIATDKPAWLQAVLDDYTNEVASVFILHGNVYDYAEHPERSLPVRDYLGTMLGALFSVAQYSPDEGVTFAGPPSVAAQARKRLQDTLGLGRPPAEPDPFLGAGGPPAGQGQEIELPRAAAQALPLLVDFLKQADGSAPVWATDSNGNQAAPPVQVGGGDGSGKLACVVVDRLDLICPPADKALLPDGKAAILALLHRLGTSTAMVDRQALMLLLVPTLEEVHPDLRLASSGIRAIEIPPPAHAQRAAYCARIVAEKGLTPEMPIAELAAQCAGLGYRHIEDLALRAEANGGVMSRALVTDRKGEMIAIEYAEVLEVLEPSVTMAMVGGHTLAKQYLTDYVVGPCSDTGLRDLAPMGLFFVGPPGTGKTFICRALANAIGWNCVLLRADKIKGQYVGQSERLLAKALAGIKALAPCVVFVDEIDQQFRRNTGGGGDGGSAVEANQFGRLLEFFGDTGHRGSILLIAASNRPDLVDAAFKRVGRVDVKIPLLPPADAAERADMLHTIMQRHGYGSEPKAAPLSTAIGAVAADTEDWTPAELEGLVVRARAIQRIKGVDSDTALSEARRRTKSADSAANRYQARLALAECDDIELVPARYRQYVGTPAPASPDGDSETAPPARTRKAGRTLAL